MNRAEQNTWRALEGKEPVRSMEEIVAELQKYVGTYHKQHGYENYRDEMYIDDILYGLGKSLSEEYEYANGFQKFRRFLIEYLGGELKEGDENV